MKKILIPSTSFLFFILTTSLQMTYTMPGADVEEVSEDVTKPTVGSDDSNNKVPSTADTASLTDTAPAPKATPLKWPETTEIAEDNKKLLQSNNKEIVQLFTLAQEVCKNIDETLSAVNKTRDEANTKYRDTIKELNPLLQLIGSAQADKNLKENS
jgi:hypothetical protein